MFGLCRNLATVSRSSTFEELGHIYERDTGTGVKQTWLDAAGNDQVTVAVMSVRQKIFPSFNGNWTQLLRMNS